MCSSAVCVVTELWPCASGPRHELRPQLLCGGLRPLSSPLPPLAWPSVPEGDDRGPTSQRPGGPSETGRQGTRDCALSVTFEQKTFSKPPLDNVPRAPFSLCPPGTPARVTDAWSYIPKTRTQVAHRGAALGGDACGVAGSGGWGSRTVGQSPWQRPKPVLARVTSQRWYSGHLRQTVALPQQGRAAGEGAAAGLNTPGCRG